MTDMDFSWPEQDVIDAWCKKYNHDIPPEQLAELKTDVTKYRIQIRRELEKLQEKIPKLPEKEWCDNCDGVGWYEGGKTLQTTCEKCKGSGFIIIKE